MCYCSLTHDLTYYLELIDDRLHAMLEDLLVKNALNNTVLILMGDHGQRIDHIQYSYRCCLGICFQYFSGRIEERMPFFAIRMPSWFAKKYPEEYANLERNQFAFTRCVVNRKKFHSNFDIHQFLADIVRMRLGKTKNQTNSTGRGISLFNEIPMNRMCNDTFVSTNFCTCLVSHSELMTESEKERSEVCSQKHRRFEECAWGA